MIETHTPVLLTEFLENSNFHKKKSCKIWDGTLGLGGHFAAWLKKNPSALGYGSDCDAKMLEKARENLKKNNLHENIKLKQANYSENPFENEGPFDIIFLDLGISSFHLDFFERGVSFRYNQTLDMRLNENEGMPVYKWLSKASENEIKTVIQKYGEERYAAKIARKINEAKITEPVTTTFQLKKICENCYPPPKRGVMTHTQRNPSVKTFQAFRIFANKEIAHLEKSLTFLPDMLEKEGRLIMISFHSLEDRLIKHEFISREKIFTDDPFAKSNFVYGDYKIITKKPIVPSDEEIELNSRARSAKMRILEKIR
ncbi:MAG: 16S rRNA (cytosine(1402)-N(4))-methyltransferase RsmH [Spirochaetia bacterium]|nr:16S rRNA (cytosine(1402)-N(4))-methyltransferase RsmH [Spirochaetia bacterium]